MDNDERQQGLLGLLGSPHARFWLWAILIIVGGMSALFVHLHPYFRQRAAARAIEAAGGEVYLEPIDYDADNFIESSWRELISAVFGDDFISQAEFAVIKTDDSVQAVGGLIKLQSLKFDGPIISDLALERLGVCPLVENISLDCTNITPAGLERLNRKLLPKLDWLGLLGKNINDDSLAQLSKTGILRQIHYLILEDCDITDEGVKWLASMPNLEKLRISKANITDDGFKHINDWATLSVMALNDMEITDAGLKHLKYLPNLDTLSLENTLVDDDAIELFRGCGDLTNLFLAGTKITDAGLARLKAFGQLNNLDISNTMITDAGLDILIEMKELNEIHVKDTKVTREGVERFRKARPKCDIDSDY